MKILVGSVVFAICVSGIAHAQALQEVPLTPSYLTRIDGGLNPADVPEYEAVFAFYHQIEAVQDTISQEQALRMIREALHVDAADSRRLYEHAINSIAQARLRLVGQRSSQCYNLATLNTPELVAAALERSDADLNSYRDSLVRGNVAELGEDLATRLHRYVMLRIVPTVTISKVNYLQWITSTNQVLNDLKAKACSH